MESKNKAALALKQEVENGFSVSEIDGQWFHYIVVNYLNGLRYKIRTPIELVELDELIAQFNRYPLLPLSDRKKLCNQLLHWLKKPLDAALTKEEVQSDEPMELWETPVTAVKGVGKKVQQALAKLDIETVWDLLHYLPIRFVDRSSVLKIRQLRVGFEATVIGRVVDVKLQRTFKGYRILTVTLEDDTGRVDLVFFNQEFLAKQFKRGQQIIVTGKVERQKNNLQLTNLRSDSFEVINGANELLPLVPIYRGGGGVSGNVLRRLVLATVEDFGPHVPEVYPYWKESRFDPYYVAIHRLHKPNSLREFEEARKQVAFREIFVLQVLLALKRLTAEKSRGISFSIEESWIKELEDRLHFKLTNAQKRVIDQILDDMRRPHPMNRLVQGDVGSGKTVVAMFAALVAAKNNRQTAVMVPTEVLAFQHYMVFSQWGEELGLRVGLLVGSMTQTEKTRTKRYMKSGQLDIVVGTHALIQEGTHFKDLGLVVIDEQHRFGVHQRAALIGMGMEKQPDVLVMTATPIPRTLVLTYYGDLDVSVIDELPPNRKPVKTFWVTSKRRSEVYEAVRRELRAGRQAYVVAPLIEESEAVEAAAATQLYEELLEGYLSGFRLGLLHGKMGKDEKKEVMDAFRRGELQVLVATPVIEVGVDVPNATVIVIEGAERFGLSQLHQLRGRVVRSAYQPYCFLISDGRTEEARERLETMVKSTDGFAIAEKDLILRGPGELLGERQHGFFGMRVADLIRDMPMLEKARQDAERLIRQDANLQSAEAEFLKKYLMKEFAEAAYLLGVG